MTNRLTSSSGKTVRASLATAACVLMLAGSAAAQAPAAPAKPAPVDPNPGDLTFTGNMDVLGNTPYIFRGIVQEADPKLTLWPAGDIGIALYSGKETLKSASVNFGVWNSLQTGSSGLDGANKKLHYEEDFYAALGLGFSKAITTTTRFTPARTAFGTVHELAFKGAFSKQDRAVCRWRRNWRGRADGGAKKGTGVELGVGPSWPLAGGKPPSRSR